MRSLFKGTSNLSLTLKICLTALFVALDVLAQKVFAINYLSFAPFLRISFAGPCIIIFASIFLGPIYGCLVGGLADLLGYLVFDPKAYPLFFQITLIYSVLGLVAYFVFRLVALIQNKKVLLLIMVGFLTALYIGASLFLILNNELTLFSSTYKIETYQKILIPAILLVLFVGLVLFIVLFDKKKSEEEMTLSPIQIGFASLILEIFVMVVFGSLMKAWAFGFKTYLIILITQSMILFINVPLNTIFLTLLIKSVFPKYVK